jgi:hypothetical protein
VEAEINLDPDSNPDQNPELITDPDPNLQIISDPAGSGSRCTTLIESGINRKVFFSYYAVHCF